MSRDTSEQVFSPTNQKQLTCSRDFALNPITLLVLKRSRWQLLRKLNLTLSNDITYLDTANEMHGYIQKPKISSPKDDLRRG